MRTFDLRSSTRYLPMPLPNVMVVTPNSCVSAQRKPRVHGGDTLSRKLNGFE
eukprot:m.1098306 g.1098306  ORF g.1098306 m.1098306 type:complete len:52 (+) comp24313_c0_seq1:2981-3136(+)